MKIRDFKYIVAAADLKNFTKAAEKCNVSQPTLSAQIKKVENMLGVKIFERGKKEVRVTDEGTSIVAAARRVLAEVEGLYEIGQMSQGPLSGKIRIGGFPTLAPYLFPKIVPQIRTHCPDLRLILIEEKTDVLIRKLKLGELDMAFLALPVYEADLESRHLFDDPFYIATPEDHALSHCSQIGQEALGEHKLLLLGEGHCLRDQSMDICKRYRVSEDADCRTTSLEILRQMVKAGTGITFMPEIAIRDEEDSSIKYIPIKNPAPHRNIGLVWRKSSTRKETIEAIYDAIKDQFGFMRPDDDVSAVSV